VSVLPEQFLPLTDFIARHAQWYPDKTAVIFENKSLTWKAFDERIRKVASHLHRAGLSKGDKVAILSPNCLEYPEIMFGALKLGAVVVPISTMLRTETVLLELEDSQPKAIFAGRSFLPLVTGYPGIENRIVLGGGAQGWTEYDAIGQSGSLEEPGTVLAADDPYNIVYSSGTTGIPKGILHTHQARLLFAMTCGLEFRVHNETVSLVSTPLYTNGTQLVYLPTILMGGTLVLMRDFDPVGFLELVEQEKCTHAFLVPTQFIRIMEHPEFDRYDTSSVEILVSAAAPLWKKTKSEILRKFPKSKLIELYGITEGISTVLRPNEQSRKLGSVGKPRLGGDIKIIDIQGRELGRGEIGEIIGSNISMMAEYHGDPDKTGEVLWFDQKKRPYIKTGDIGRLDEEGYLYILDRKKDLIISGGINIFPSDLEQVLRTHPEIAEAVVIGVPHSKWGETPLALVVKKDPASPLSETDLRDWANSRLAGYQKLAGVEFRSSFPKNDLQKILKNQLRAPYWKSFPD
jgi:acyl-CoA synthetase (AMP-forming)/AMP-acid ligase II